MDLRGSLRLGMTHSTRLGPSGQVSPERATPSCHHYATSRQTAQFKMMPSPLIFILAYLFPLALPYVAKVVSNRFEVRLFIPHKPPATLSCARCLSHQTWRWICMKYCSGQLDYEHSQWGGLARTNLSSCVAEKDSLSDSARSQSFKVADRPCSCSRYHQASSPSIPTRLQGWG